MTLRANRTNRWASPVAFVALAGGFLAAGYENLVNRGLGEAWFFGALAIVSVAFAVGVRAAYIRVDDSTIVFGPNFLGRRTFDRREVVKIWATRSPLTRRTFFLRADGSTLWGTSGFFWGRDGLQRLADYLGVPFEGWD